MNLTTTSDPEHPAGLIVRDDFLDDREHEGLPYAEVRMRGQVARRSVVHVGDDDGYESWALTPAPDLPEALHDVRDRAAALAGLAPDALAATLIARDPPGATIGRHRDSRWQHSIPPAKAQRYAITFRTVRDPARWR